jgi:hypothetical protein
MGDQKNQNPNYGSEQGRKDEDQKNQNERAGQRRDQEQPGQGQTGQGQPGQGPGGQSGDRDRASNPQNEGEMGRNPKPGQPSGQNTDR